MDLERIKQNLRLRSGRSKKTRKQPVTQSNAGPHTAQPDQKKIPNGIVQKPARPTQQSTATEAHPPQIDGEKKAAAGEPSPAEIVNQRPNLPHAATGMDLKPSAKMQAGRRSVERPQRDSAKGSTSLRTISEV